MRYRFEKLSRNNTLLSIVMVLLGLVLFIWPGQTLELAAKILGIGLLVGAAVSGVNWYYDRHKVSAGYTTLAVAIVCLVAGIIVLVAPRGVVSLLPKLIGAAVLLNGIVNLAQAVELRRFASGGWTPAMVMAALTIALGIFLLVFSFSAMKMAVMAIGGVCVYNGASNLWIESRYRKQ